MRIIERMLEFHQQEAERQKAELLDRLFDSERMYWDGGRLNYLVRKSVIEAEREKLEKGLSDD